jgi:hypothetical protein
MKKKGFGKTHFALWARTEILAGLIQGSDRLEFQSLYLVCFAPSTFS